MDGKKSIQKNNSKLLKLGRKIFEQKITKFQVEKLDTGRDGHLCKNKHILQCAKIESNGPISAEPYSAAYNRHQA